MSELISRSMAKAEIMDWARVITNPKMLATEDTMHILDSMDGATDEEFKAEAKRRGYRLVKISEKVKTVSPLPCICGRKKIGRWVNVYNAVFCRCDRCGLEAESAWTNEQAKLNWNKMIERNMKDAAD